MHSSSVHSLTHITSYCMQVTPSWGWILSYEYTFLFFFLLYGKCLHFFSVAGRASGHHLSLNRVGHMQLMDTAIAWLACSPELTGYRAHCQMNCACACCVFNAPCSAGLASSASMDEDSFLHLHFGHLAPDISLLEHLAWNSRLHPQNLADCCRSFDHEYICNTCFCGALS